MTTQIQGQYHGQSKPLFTLYLKTALLTLITLGIYRFWAKTRIRKYVWSATSGDGDSFEYTGTGLEKFLGFLVAIVILAIYVGIVQMVLFYFGLNLFTVPENTAQEIAQLTAIYVTFFAVLPLLLFAQYRARRYKLARTRWRGLRFGMDSAAWSFAFRAMGYYVLVILTLGILSPLATFKLEKFMGDRTWYGDAKFVQEGRWQALFKGMKHVLFGLVILIGLPVLAALTEVFALMFIGLFVGYIWLLIGLVYYRIYALNYMMSHRVLDQKITFTAQAQTSKVVTIFIVGTIVIGLVAGVIFGVAAAMMAGIFANLNEAVLTGGGFGFAGVALVVVLYVVALLIIGGLSLIMITQPIIEHIVTNVTVHDEENHLNTIRQRAADTGADAEGFADALDVGGAL